MDTLSLMVEYPFFYEINLTIVLGNSVYYNIMLIPISLTR